MLALPACSTIWPIARPVRVAQSGAVVLREGAQRFGFSAPLARLQQAFARDCLGHPGRPLCGRTLYQGFPRIHTVFRCALPRKGPTLVKPDLQRVADLGAVLRERRIVLVINAAQKVAFLPFLQRGSLLPRPPVARPLQVTLQRRSSHRPHGARCASGRLAVLPFGMIVEGFRLPGFPADYPRL
jgi:hypothetical protein